MSDLKIRLFLAAVTIVGMIVLAGTYRGVRGAASGPAPRVTAITQVTHDGYRKTNLLADDAQLFVNESLSSERVIAKVALPGSGRSVVASLVFESAGSGPFARSLDVAGFLEIEVGRYRILDRSSRERITCANWRSVGT